MVDDFHSGFITVGFTLPEALSSPEEEAEAICSFLEYGEGQEAAIDLFHIRKPLATIEYTRRLIECLHPSLRNRLVLHSHYALCREFEFGGIHFNPSEPDSFVSSSGNNVKGMRSRSMHSLEELKETSSDGFSYVFLSPIFDSISKTGYKSRFTDAELILISRLPHIKVMALGGVTPDHFEKLMSLKFAGAALLGYLWSLNSSLEKKIETLKEARQWLNNIINTI